MCIAIPGKVVAVDGMQAKVDYSGNQVTVNTGKKCVPGRNARTHNVKFSMIHYDLPLFIAG